MCIISFLFVLLSIVTVKARDCPNDKSNLAPVRLKSDLLCGYDSTFRPVVNHKNPVRVVIRLILKYFIYDAQDGSFTIDSWLAMFWKDEHLKWDPSKYESITQIQMVDYEIWMPDISVYNRKEQSGSPAAVESASCIVSSVGQVVCVPPAHHMSLCVGDLTRFPFDTQNCTVRFGSWVHNGEEIDIRLAKTPISTDDLVANGEWELIDKKAIKHPGKFKCCPNNTYPSINFNFQIRRLPGSHVASVILPAIALVVITLTSLWMSPSHSERLLLCCINLICGFFYVSYVSYMLPSHGHNVPLILLFARDSIVLTAFTIVLSVILKSMVVNVKPAPGWISAIVSILTASKPGQFIFLNNSTTKGMASTQSDEDGAAIINVTDVNPLSQEWITFAKILDRLCFLIYLVLYVIMFVSFTP